MADGTNLKTVVITIPNGTAPATNALTWITLSTAVPIVSSDRAAGLGVSAGKTYRAGLTIQLTNGVNVIPVGFSMKFKVDGVTTNETTFQTALYTADDVLPNGTYHLLTPTFSVPTSFKTIELSSLQWIVGFVPGSNAGGTIHVRRPYIREFTYIAAWP